MFCLYNRLYYGKLIIVWITHFYYAVGGYNNSWLVKKRGGLTPLMAAGPY